MRFAYTIVYVTDVTKTVEFYESAFGLKRRFIHEAGDYAEMETGETVLAFAQESLAGYNGFEITPNRAAQKPAGFELCFVTDDVAGAHQTAALAGAIEITPPTEKPWGQTVSYVRDLNGCLVEIASPVPGA